jgi:hypothetical protein
MLRELLGEKSGVIVEEEDTGDDGKSENGSAGEEVLPFAA